MKVTVEAETAEEKAALSETWVRTGCERVAIACYHAIEVDAGLKAERPECGFIHGPLQLVKTDVARLTVDLDVMLVRQTTIEGVIQANQMIAQAHQQAEGVRKALNGKPLRIAP